MLMQPQSPPPAPPPAPSGNGQNQYDFIMNPQSAPGRSLLPGGNTKKGRLIIAGIGAVVLLMIVLVVTSLFSNAGKADTQAVINAAKQQQELIRIADIGIQKARGQQAKNLAITTKLALSSEQDDMQSAIKAAGLNPKKVLVGSTNPQTDKALTTAEQTNRFDEEFIEVMTDSLAEYQRSVKAAYDGANSKKLKAALATQYASANTLVGTPAPSN